MIRVLIADDHQMFLDGIESFLDEDPNIEVVAQANNGNEVIAKLKQVKVDVLVLDIDMGTPNGVDTAAIIRKQYPSIKILMLSMYNRREYLLEIMKIGAMGYVLKDKSKEQLIHAIHQVYRGTVYYGLEILNELQTARLVKATDEPELTDREKDVLTEIGNGLSTKQISKKLEIEETTVNTHKRNLRHKLEADNEKHLVRYAIKHGYSKL
ncbi:MAG: response regulator transcription factor [Bacteroidota bacterium]